MPENFSLSISCYLIWSRALINYSLFPHFRSICSPTLMKTVLILSLIVPIFYLIYISNSSNFSMMLFLFLLISSLICLGSMFIGDRSDKYFLALLITILIGLIWWSLCYSLKHIPQITHFSKHLGSTQTRLRD